MKVNRLSISGRSLQDKWRHRHLNSRDCAFQNGPRFQVLTDFSGREDISVFSLVAFSYILWTMNRCDNMKSRFIWTFKPDFLISLTFFLFVTNPLFLSSRGVHVCVFLVFCLHYDNAEEVLHLLSIFLKVQNFTKQIPTIVVRTGRDTL